MGHHLESWRLDYFCLHTGERAAQNQRAAGRMRLRTNSQSTSCIGGRFSGVCHWPFWGISRGAHCPLPPRCLSIQYWVPTLCSRDNLGRQVTDNHNQYSLTRDLREESPRRLLDPQEGHLTQPKSSGKGSLRTWQFKLSYEKIIGISKAEDRLGWARLG